MLSTPSARTTCLVRMSGAMTALTTMTTQTGAVNMTRQASVLGMTAALANSLPNLTMTWQSGSTVRTTTALTIG